MEKNKKWFIFLAIAVILGIIVAAKSCASRVEADVVVSYIGEGYFSSEDFYANAKKLEDAIDDINGDGIKKAEAVSISFSSNLTAAQEQANLTKMSMSMGHGDSRVYIMDKNYCMRYADEEILADLSEFDFGDAKTLVNSKGEVYGVCIKDNSLVKELGVDDTENLYIALRAVTEMDEINFKNIDAIDENARKIIELIIKNN